MSDYWMISDLSGQKFLRSEMRKTYRGTWVHWTEWEERHPQEYIKARSDTIHIGPSRIGTGSNADGGDSGIQYLFDSSGKLLFDANESRLAAA